MSGIPLTNSVTKNHVKLTQGRILAFSTDKHQTFLWHTVVQGLALRATNGAKAGSNDKKAFIFQGKLDGDTIRITIGSVKDWTLDDAEKKARELQSQIDQGKDPRRLKREEITKNESEITARHQERLEWKRQEVTLAQAWAVYVDTQCRRAVKPWSEHHIKDHAKMVRPGGSTSEPGPLAPLMTLRLVDLSKDRVENWLRTETPKRPTQTALAFRLLRAFLRWCDKQENFRAMPDVSAVGTDVRRQHVPRVKSKKNDCLGREQLHAWLTAVRATGNPVISAYLQSLLITGSRREELAGLRWVDVDFQWKRMSIRDKVEGERVIPLTPYVAHLLAALPRRNEWVFSSVTAESGRLQEPRSAHTRALKVAGLPHVTLHGLRRSFSTLSEWTETPAGIVAQIMGHKPSAIAEKHYKDRPLDLLHMWHTKIEAWMLEQAGIDQPKEVVRALRMVK